MNVSRGFSGRRTPPNAKLPPGQYLTTDFPVLSAGPTPHVALDTWELTIRQGREVLQRWDWQTFRNLPSHPFAADIHCVTRWSKFDTRWEGVSLDLLFADIETSATHVMAHSYNGYSTNLPLKDLLGGRAWVAFRYEGEELAPEHGGPARLLVPHVYFWKSAKWLTSLSLLTEDQPGFWEARGYHMYGDPWREQRYSEQ